MKITDNRKTEHVPFSSIKLGEAFMHAERLHMRIEEDNCNAVDLENGTLRYLEDEELVYTVSAIITIQS